MEKMKECKDFGVSESKFNLTNKGIGDDALILLVEFLMRFKIKIKNLWLMGNDLTDAGIVKLAEYFETNQANHRPTLIDLQFNGPFTSDGLRSLLSSLKSGAVKMRIAPEIIKEHKLEEMANEVAPSKIEFVKSFVGHVK